MNQMQFSELLREWFVHSPSPFLLCITVTIFRKWFNEHTSRDFIHHNQHFAGDRETLIFAIEEDARANPEKQVEVKMSLVDGDLVTTYSHVKQNPDNPGFALMHIFRFADSRIVKVWDISQAIMEESPNEYGMF